jgi:hypothetical protein
MFDFIASLALLIALTSLGAEMLLLFPLLPYAILFPFRQSYLGKAWTTLLSALSVAYFWVSMVVQLTQEHQKFGGNFTGWYPYISAIMLLVVTLESSIDKRDKVIQEDSKWTRYPEYSPALKFWRVVPALIVPFFLFLFYFPSANVPFIYAGLSVAMKWLFHLGWLGIILKVLAGLIGALLLWGGLKLLLVRTIALFLRSSKKESAHDEYQEEEL